MLTNTPAVTVWEKTIVNRAAFYVRHQTGAAYWEETQGQTVGGMARDADNNVLVIIHASCIGEYIPKPGDRIANGISESAQPPSDALTVTAVKRFLYGPSAGQHIEVTAK